MKVLIFGGTSEGRELALCLAKNKISCEVCVATQYGSELLSDQDCLHVHQGRLTTAEMLSLLSDGFSAVIDATHPFALEVSDNISQALKQYNEAVHPGDVKKCLPLLRFDRQAATKAASPLCRLFTNAGECALALKSTSGRILLTTGSKNLSDFCADQDIRSRLVVRTLPSTESLELCIKNGLQGNQILAMQGPFSKETNAALIRQYGISVLVTKESGTAGGYQEKLEAARECGISAFVIKKPQNSSSQAEIYSNFSALFARLEEILSVKINFTPKLQLTLAGAGMGNPDTLTLAAKKAIAEADYIFGAERVLETVRNLATTTKIHPLYLAKDIMPILQEARSSTCSQEIRAVVLFSGDTGFYSGADAFYKEAEKLPATQVEIIPGISCVQYLCAKFHKNWQNYEFLSLHGVKKADWVNKLSDIVYNNRQIFFITSSFSDLQDLSEEISKLLQAKSADADISKVKIFLGFNLSYSDEKLSVISLQECSKISAPGLYCGVIEL